MYRMKITVHCSWNLLIVKRVKNLNGHNEEMQLKMETSHIIVIHAALYVILCYSCLSDHLYYKLHISILYSKQLRQG